MMVDRELPRERTIALAIKLADNGMPELDRAEAGAFEADDEGGTSLEGNVADKQTVVGRPRWRRHTENTRETLNRLGTNTIGLTASREDREKPRTKIAKIPQKVQTAMEAPVLKKTSSKR